MTKNTAPWLHDSAAKYADKLRRIPNTVTQVRNSDVGELTFDNELSKAILLAHEMEPVWDYLNALNTHMTLPGPSWKHFLVEIQDGVRGPKKVELRTAVEIREDADEIKKHASVIKRILRRYHDGDITVGRIYGRTSISDFFDKSELELAMRNENVVPIDEVLDALNRWIHWNEVILRLVKSPNHPDMPYQYFVRKMYSFFHYLDESFNQWALIARIANTCDRFEPCDSEKVRGTCRDMAEELAKPY